MTTQINIIFHGVSGHTFRVTEAISEGVAEVARCHAKLLRIAEPNASNAITMPDLELCVSLLAVDEDTLDLAGHDA